jgi:predicted nucleotidyltransferase
MITQETLKKITNEITQAAKTVLGDKLHKVILYGSYARGDFHEYSDIDIMVLADVENEETRLYDKKIDELTGWLDLEYNVLIESFVKSKQQFDKYLPVLPYFQNVINDGVELYVNSY